MLQLSSFNIFVDNLSEGLFLMLLITSVNILKCRKYNEFFETFNYFISLNAYGNFFAVKYLKELTYLIKIYICVS